MMPEDESLNEAILWTQPLILVVNLNERRPTLRGSLSNQFALRLPNKRGTNGDTQLVDGPIGRSQMH